MAEAWCLFLSEQTCGAFGVLKKKKKFRVQEFGKVALWTKVSKVPTQFISNWLVEMKWRRELIQYFVNSNDNTVTLSLDLVTFSFKNSESSEKCSSVFEQMGTVLNGSLTHITAAGYMICKRILLTHCQWLTLMSCAYTSQRPINT